MSFDEGMLVSRRWLERVDQAVFGSSQSEVDGCQSASLFYDVRPARLQTAWTQNAAGVWVASACFIVNDVADDSFVFPVLAPTATANPGGTVGTTRFNIVWRGRWELIASDKETTGAQILAKLNVTSASTVTDVSTTTETVAVPTSGTVSLSSVDAVTLSLSDSSSTGAVEVVTDIQASAGAIGVETKYLSAAATTAQQTANVSLTTTNKTLIKSVTKTTANRVASITARNS